MNGKKAKYLRKLAYGESKSTGKRFYQVNPNTGEIRATGPRSSYQLMKYLYKWMKRLGNPNIRKGKMS